MKKKLITLCLVIMSVCCFSLAIACSNGDGVPPKAEFKPDFEKNVLVGSEVDLEDYIVRQENSTTTIEITYDRGTDGNKTEKFVGYDTIFYPKYEGKHTLKYTVTKGKKSDSATTEFNAKYPAAEISFLDAAYSVQLNRKTTSIEIPFSDIYYSDTVNMIMRNSNVDQPEIVAYAKADSYDPIKSPSQHTFPDDTALEAGAYSFVFEDEGLYRFKAEVINKSLETSSAYIYVLVVKGEYSRQYKSSMDSDGVVTIKEGKSSLFGNSWTTDYGYYGLGLYSAGDTLEFEFTGKNIPNVALFTDMPSGQAVGGGKGMYIQTSNNGNGWSHRLLVTTPNRLETGRRFDYATYDTYDLGKNDYENRQDMSAGNNNGITGTSYFGLLMLGDSTQYRYVIQTEQAGKYNVILTLSLYKKVDGGEELVKMISGKNLSDTEKANLGLTADNFNFYENFNIRHKLPSIYGTYAIAYSAGSYSPRSISFKYNITTSTRTAGLDRNSDTLEIAMPASTNETAFYGAGTYGVNDTYRATFAGNNVSDIVLFANKIDGTADKGLYFTIDAEGTKIYNTPSKTGAPVYTSDKIKNSDLQNKYYSLVITQVQDGTKLKFTVTLNEFNYFDDIDTPLKTFTTSDIDFDIATLGGKYALAYAKDVAISCSADVIKYVDPSIITLKKGSENRAKLIGSQVTDPANSTTNWNYIATEAMGEYDTLRVYFSGQDIPNLVILSDTNEGQAYDATGNSKGYAYIAAQGAGGYKRFYASGPNRACLDAEGFFGRGSETFINSGATDSLARMMLDVEKDYVLIVSSYRTEGGLILSYNVEDAQTGKLIASKNKLVNDDYSKTLYKNATDKYYAIIYGNAFSDISFTFEVEKANWVEINATNIDLLKTATNGYYKLTEDIDMSGYTNWSGTSEFMGVLDGQGHAIKNLKTQGFFYGFAGYLKNIAFTRACFVNTAQDGIVAEAIGANALIENVVVETYDSTDVAYRTNSKLSGALCKVLNGNITLNNVIIVTGDKRNNKDYGYVSGFANKNAKVTANNCYFVGHSYTVISGCRFDGDYNNAYYNDVWSETAGYNHLASNADDTNYSNFFTAGSTYKIINHTYSQAMAQDVFEADETVTLTAMQQALYAKLG